MSERKVRIRPYRFSKRMRELQVLVRKDGQIQLLCKGADTTVYERLSSDCADMMELTTSNLNVCALYSSPQLTLFGEITALKNVLLVMEPHTSLRF